MPLKTAEISPYSLITLDVFVKVSYYSDNVFYCVNNAITDS